MRSNDELSGGCFALATSKPNVQSALLSLLLLLVGATSSQAQIYPNILMIVADDLGVEKLASYGVGSAPPATPAIDRLAAEGMVFRNAWSNPVCSTTRATIQTGQFSFRTGIGSTVDEPDLGLRHDIETTLAEMIARAPVADYTTAAFGKWHLNGEDDPDGFGFTAVGAAGFDHFEGTMRNLQAFFGGTYFSYEKVTNGIVEDIENSYATSDTVDWAVDYLSQAAGPWFGYVAFHAPHQPFHRPPEDLAETTDCIDGQSGDEMACVRAMITAMDTEIDRLIRGVSNDEPLVVIFIGDNGTDGRVAEPPFSESHAKGSLWEGGINVPMIFWSPGLIDVGTSDALVNTVDLFATIAEIVGYDYTQIPALDSVTLTPYLLGNVHPAPRRLNFAELFKPNGCDATPQTGQAIRDERYKLIRLPANTGEGEEFFDLTADRWEKNDLLPDLTGPQLFAYERLSRALDTLVVGIGDSCSDDRECCTRNCVSNTCQEVEVAQ